MWNHEWTNNLVLTDEFDAFPLQFANAERIEANDVVCIFDEVGCGKTISAGLIALNYLYNNKSDKVVQIVTINSVVRPISDRTYGQFLNDWFEKLPFSVLGLGNRISICNNHYKNLQKIVQAEEKGEQNVGLLIVDEAHLFLEDSLRREMLKKIKADKVVFLTATPIKQRSLANLNIYTDIASSVLGRTVNIEWEKELFWTDNGKCKPICSKFDIKSPVSRYFKDTVTALEYVEDGKIEFEKKKAKRLLPQIWEFDVRETNGKVKALIEEIKKRPYDKDGKRNRFVIFTRYIEKEADYIEQKLLEESDCFARWEGNGFPDKWTVVNINGQSEARATSFSHNGTKKPLPDIIIITYQIAEQGINLPGYNYVINYHISAFPASLEQRFGRIDRMGKKNPSQYEEINMVFLLSKTGWETYKANFNTAVYIYRNNLITSIPAKNVLLEERILSKLEDDKALILNYFQEIEKEAEKGESLRRTYQYLCNCNQKDGLRMQNNPEKEHENRLEDECPKDMLTEFCVEHEIFIHAQDSENELQEAIKQTIEKCREPYVSSKKSKTNEEVLEILKKVGIGDKIYYFTSDGGLETFDAIKECAKDIYDSQAYKDYEKKFYEQVKLPKLIEKYRDRLEVYFENMFFEGNGCFDKIFMLKEEYKKLFSEEILIGEQWEDIKSSDKRMLCEYADIVVDALPFFKMVQKYDEIICNYLFTENGWLRESYDIHLPQRAVERLHRLGYIPASILERMDGLKNLFFTAKIEDNFECSRWFKLFYFCMDVNAMNYYEFIKKYNALTCSAEQKWLNLLEEYCSAESIAYDGESDFDEAERIKSAILYNEGIEHYDSIEGMLLGEYQEELAELLKIIFKVRNEVQRNVSFFHVFFAPEGGKTGKWRSPYWGGKTRWDKGSRNWSELLPIVSEGRGYNQVWGLMNYKTADFATYMIFNEIGAGAVDEKRTTQKEWWLEHFIPERCNISSECGETIRSILEKCV